MVKILSFDVGIINLAYCIFDTSSCLITNWEVIELATKKSSKFSGKVPSGNESLASASNDIHINLIKALDSRPHLLETDIVLIEKQPSFNPKMRIIGGCLQSYFYIRGVIDKGVISSVEFFSPKHKLKCYTGPAITLESKAKGKYAQTKKMGIAIAQIKLKEYNEPVSTIKIYENSKKKDDLSDCYLQALTYATFKKMIPVSSKNVEPKVMLKSEPKSETKVMLKKKLKEYLDANIKICSVVELLNAQKFNIIHLKIPQDLMDSLKLKYTFNDIPELLTQMNLKRYITQKYNIS